MDQPRKTALVLSGGGARGAYQVGVLKALAEGLQPGQMPFSIITGISVGALNAVVLASSPNDFRAGVEKLEAIWQELTCQQVYRTDLSAMVTQLGGWMRALLFGWMGANPPRSLLDNAPLRKLVETHVDFQTIKDSVGRSALEAIAITASSYATGQAITFFQGQHGIEPWRRARRHGRAVTLTADHVMASSALPLVFPSVRIGREWFGDGALRDNAPLSAAIHLGCDHIVVIGARDGKPDTSDDDTSPPPHPSLGDLSGQLLDIVFNDDLEADAERLARINTTLAMMDPAIMTSQNLRHIGLTRVQPTEDVRCFAGEHLDELPRSVRLILRYMGALRAPYVVPSYLTFEPGYIGALMEMGYKDGLKTDWDTILRAARARPAYAANGS